MPDTGNRRQKQCSGEDRRDHECPRQTGGNNKKRIDARRGMKRPGEEERWGPCGWFSPTVH